MTSPISEPGLPFALLAVPAFEFGEELVEGLVEAVAMVAALSVAAPEYNAGPGTVY